MKNEDKQIKDLIIGCAFLKYSNYKKDSRITREAIDRMEQEYIELTGYEIKDNDEYKKLLSNYDKQLRQEGYL